MGLYESFYWQMYQQVATKAVSKGCFTLMEAVGEKEEKEWDSPNPDPGAEGRQPDHLSEGCRMSILKVLNRKANVPILYLDFCTEDRKTDAVISDSYLWSLPADQLSISIWDIVRSDILERSFPPDLLQTVIWDI